MLKVIKYSLWPKKTVFSDGIEKIVDTIRKEFRLSVTSFKARDGDSVFIIQIDDNEHVRFEKYTKFISYFRTVSQFVSFDCNISFHKKLTMDFDIKGIWIQYRSDGIQITCHSEDARFVDRSHEIAKGILNLERVIRYDPDQYRWKYLDPKIFISRHFDSIGNKYYSDIEPFLSLLGFDVNQGEEYTSGSIPDKVKHRIDIQDIVLVIVSGNREHEWLIAEIGYAEGQRKHVIILKERGIEFNTTIMGKDYEYIEFDQQYIQVSYSKLIREFRSVRIKGIL
jgi:hypothetical protein